LLSDPFDVSFVAMSLSSGQLFYYNIPVGLEVKEIFNPDYAMGIVTRFEKP